MKNQKGHQGDVQFKSIWELPPNLKSIDKTPIAYGEHSGHQHILTGDYELKQDETGTIYAIVGKGGAIVQHIHESQFKGYDSVELLPKADHKPIVLEPDTNYIFGIHRRYQPFKKIFEKVID